MLQFPSLPNGIVKNCYYLQKLAEEKKLERESSFSFTANSASNKFQQLPLRGELKLGLQRGKHQRDCTFA